MQSLEKEKLCIQIFDSRAVAYFNSACSWIQEEQNKRDWNTYLYLGLVLISKWHRLTVVVESKRHFLRTTFSNLFRCTQFWAGKWTGKFRGLWSSWPVSCPALGDLEVGNDLLWGLASNPFPSKWLAWCVISVIGCKQQRLTAWEKQCYVLGGPYPLLLRAKIDLLV